MNKISYAIFIILFICTSHAEIFNPDQLKETFENLEQKLNNKVEIGTRIVHYKLKTETKKSFVGSVNKLDINQNYDPTRLFLDINLKRIGQIEYALELSWERISADTITRSDGHNDGTFEVSGPLLGIHAKFHNDSKFLPYAGIGAVYFNSTNTSKGWWHYGFPLENGDVAASEQAYVDWLQSGAPAWPNNGYTRNFDLDKTWGWVFYFGTNFNLNENFAIDLYARYTDVEFENTFTLARYGETFRETKHDIPLNNYAIGIGIRYKFKETV